jgi:hypothetical protein
LSVFAPGLWIVVNPAFSVSAAFSATC